MSSADKHTERTEVKTTIAVRTDNGFFFGTLRWYEASRALIEIDAPLEPGEAADMRITLAPTSSTALVNGVIGRVLATAVGETPRFILLIKKVTDEDAALLSSWVRNVRARGTLSNFDTVSAVPRSADPMRQNSPSEVRHALERLARKPLSPTESTATDPFGARSDVMTHPTAGGGRSAVREALRGAIARSASTRSPRTLADEPNPLVGRVVATAPSGPRSPSSPERARSVPPPERPYGDGAIPERARSVPPPERPYGGGAIPERARSVPPPERPYGDGAIPERARSVPPPERPYGGAIPERARSVPPPESPYGTPSSPGRVVAKAAPADRPFDPAPPTSFDPTYAVSSTRLATWVEVRWNTPSLFDRDARLQLANQVLVLPRQDQPLPDRDPVRVMLRHGLLQLECAARVQAVGSSGGTYRLSLDPMQLEQLREWSRDYGRK